MLTFVMLRWDGSVCRLSVKWVGLHDEKTAPVSASTNCFVQTNSRKPGPWNYSLTCRPVLTQILVPKKQRVKTVKNFRRLTRWPLRKPRTKSKSPPMLLGYGLSCSTDRSDGHKNLLTANLNSLTRSGKKTELTTSYIQRGNIWD